MALIKMVRGSQLKEADPCALRLFSHSDKVRRYVILVRIVKAGRMTMMGPSAVVMLPAARIPLLQP
jgi:hypothetical protein